jgi:hypothetical protein
MFRFCGVGAGRAGGVGVAGLSCACAALAARSAAAQIAAACADRRNEELREPIFNGFSSRTRNGRRSSIA